MTRPILSSLIVVILGFLWTGASLATLLPRAKLTLMVVDEQGSGLEGASVGIGFEKNTGWGVKEIPIKGRTNMSGIFTASASAMSHVGFTVKKPGYYQTVGKYVFTERKLGRWLPWNPQIVVVLRERTNPIPMFARDFDQEIPELGQRCGFDLIKYDWVSPFGTGSHEDIIFKVQKSELRGKKEEYILTIAFPGESDGIQLIKEDLLYGSELKLPRLAPQDGYERELKRTKTIASWGGFEANYVEDANYIFRIRSEEKHGEFYRGVHGKILGEIRFDPVKSKTAFILFKYYLNPDYTRNLEFDPARNLFKNLKRSERVGIR